MWSLPYVGNTALADRLRASHGTTAPAGANVRRRIPPSRPGDRARSAAADVAVREPGTTRDQGRCSGTASLSVRQCAVGLFPVMRSARSWAACRKSSRPDTGSRTVAGGERCRTGLRRLVRAGRLSGTCCRMRSSGSGNRLDMALRHPRCAGAGAVARERSCAGENDRSGPARLLNEAPGEAKVGQYIVSDSREFTLRGTANGPEAPVLCPRRSGSFRPQGNTALDETVEIRSLGQRYAELPLLWKFR